MKAPLAPKPADLFTPLPTSETKSLRRDGPQTRYGRSRISILKSAADLFFSQGYDVSLDEIASKATLSKTTLYNHFDTKRDLLEAVVHIGIDQFIDRIHAAPAFDLRDILTHYASLYGEIVLSEVGIKRYRLIVADISKFPDLAAALFDAGIARSTAALAAQLDVGIAAGKVRPIHAARTAERFFGALTGFIPRRTFAGLGSAPPGGLKIYIEETVGLFVEALSPVVGSRPQPTPNL